MILLKTKNYKKQVNSLLKKDQRLLAIHEGFLVENIFYSKLHTKKLHGFGKDYVYSFRITSSYRGIFRLTGENIILFAIGHRKDIYQSFE